jgi:hypothetical protein
METKSDSFIVPKVWAERGFWVALLTLILGYFGLDVSDRLKPTNEINVQPAQSLVQPDDKELQPFRNAFNSERAYTRAALQAHAEHIIAIEQQLKLQPLKPGAPPPINPNGSIGKTETDK